MASPYTVNINVNAGVDFSQQFTITGPDLAPVDITGYKFYAQLAKHPTAIDANVSTSGSPVYEYRPFTTRVISGTAGTYSISMDSTNTSKLEEGKYVYNIIMEDLSGDKTSVISGLAFVDVAFGATT